MTLKQISVRIPETTHRYLKNKANLSGMKMQDLIAQIFIDYQNQDVEYMDALADLVSEAQKKQQGQGGNDGV